MLTDRDRARMGPRSQKEPGSPEWCWQTLDIFKHALRHVDEQHRQAEEIFAELRSARAWQKVPPESPYGSFDAMLKAETGMSQAALRSHIKTAREKYGAVEAAVTNGGDRRSEDFQSRDTILKCDTAERTVARLKRDDPALAERVVNGELSPNAAARAKGWRRPRVVLSSPASVAEKIRQHWTPDQIAELRDLLT